MSILGQAMENGIEIHQFDKDNQEGLEETLGNLALSDSEKFRIKQDIEAGRLITIPDEDVTIGSWTGTGYISLDKSTGAGAYMISGSLNGGAKPAIATGNTASVFYTERGAYVIVDDITNEIVQISDNIDPTTWIPDTSIINPYIPEK